ncbi:MAG: CRISPR system precrRNA processing endoribonuclease RAMP protein Cas6 [Magnetococcales bacterium]|nr:CRISPR system precrRNA processing endoribonuclease RAMP protein Cas6 [Magnetococcales bacterium]
MTIYSLPLARYRLEWRVETALRLPEYAGSALRGVFGAALRGVACFTRERTCEGCGLLRTCPYSLIFETPAPLVVEGEKSFAVAPNPYIIEPPAWGARDYLVGEALVFHLVLAGRALAQLPLLILAWQRALARGVGPGDGRADLSRVVLERENGEEMVFSAEEGVLHDHETLCVVPPWPGGESLALDLLTPTRIQRDGSPLGPGRLTPRDLLVGLMRRVGQIAQIHVGTPLEVDYVELAHRAGAIACHGNLSWRDWTRRSGRQQQTMALGGVVGQWTLTGDLQSFWPFVYLGQWLHVGKNATFGLGGYSLLLNKGL